MLTLPHIVVLLLLMLHNLYSHHHDVIIMLLSIVYIEDGKVNIGQNRYIYFIYTAFVIWLFWRLNITEEVLSPSKVQNKSVCKYLLFYSQKLSVTDVIPYVVMLRSYAFFFTCEMFCCPVINVLGWKLSHRSLAETKQLTTNMEPTLWFMMEWV